MPRRGDRVIPIEDVRRDGDRVKLERPPGPKTHIADPGEDILEGALLVAAGDVIRPTGVGALAACGISRLAVHRRPRVALVATGDELVDASDGAAALPAGRIFNSNAVTLAGLLRAIGCVVDYEGIVGDRPDELRTTLGALHGNHDVVLSTGGVSVGRYDAVHRTWLDLGARRIVGRVDLKPGGPFFAGQIGDAWTIGLSGTPVACLAAFHLLVRPLLARLSGRRHSVRPHWFGSLDAGFPRASDRTRVLWARVEEGTPGPPRVELLVGESSGRLTSLLRANALALIPHGTPPLPAGSRVTVLMLDREEDRDRLRIRRPSPGPLVIGVVGESATGKTTVIAALIRRLTADGLRVAAVKHAAHGFEFDRAGSDSDRMADAGAGVVVLAGPEETALRVRTAITDSDQSVRLIAGLSEQVWGDWPDLILIEGMAHPSRPVIQIGRQKPGVVGEVWAALPAAEERTLLGLEPELGRVVAAIRDRIGR